MAPRSAATWLQTAHRKANACRHSHFYKLSNEDMSLVAHIFQGLSADEVQERVHTLPRYLRASGFHMSPSSNTGRVQPGYLCDLHKKLKKGLCYELMSLIQHEISRIGRFMYSVIMSGELVAWEETRMRQLEPIPQMYIADFDPREGAAEGREPIVPRIIDEKGISIPQWYYQVNQCPACMLARIGADDKVLFALLAGLVGRISTLKSRRIRFVKDWLETRMMCQTLVDDAFYLGGRMRDIKREQRRRAQGGRWREEQTCEMQARQARDIRVAILGHRGINKPNQPESCAAADATGYGGSVVDIDRSGPYAQQHGVAHRPDHPKFRTATDATGHRESVVGIDISGPYAPQYQQASSRPIRDASSPTDQYTAIGVDAFRPGSWRLRNNIPCSYENVVSGENARGPDRKSAGIGVDISDPFIPAHRQPSSYRPAHCEPDAEEILIPTSTQPRTTPPLETPVCDRSRRSGILFARSTSMSIASSFASDVSISDLRAPSMAPSLVPSPLRTPGRRLPTVPERSANRVQRPHPLSIYGTADDSSTATAERFAEVSPPSTPTKNSTGHAHSQYDVSPPSSPELDEYEVSPPGTHVMHLRPVKSWSALYES